MSTPPPSDTPEQQEEIEEDVEVAADEKKVQRRAHQEYRKSKRMQDCASTLKIIIVVWVGLPAVMLLWSIICGALLAAMEGWEFKDGFFYVGSPMSASLGGLTPLIPQNHGSRFFVIIACSWGLGIFACGSAILATPIVAPLVRLFRLDVHAEV